MSRSRRLVRLTLGLAASLVASAAANATTLEEAIAAAMRHAPEIMVADAETDAAKARLDQARSGRLPTATLSGTIGYGRLDPRNFFGLGAANVTPRAAQVAVEQRSLPVGESTRVSTGRARGLWAQRPGKAARGPSSPWP